MLLCSVTELVDSQRLVLA